MRNTLHAVLIILLNALPLYALFYWHWQVFDMIFLYWLENLVIGIFAALSVLLHPARSVLAVCKQSFIAVFFTVHFGIFCTLHGLFVFILFGGYAEVFNHHSLLYTMIWPLLQQNGLIYCAISLLLLNAFYWLLDMHKVYTSEITEARMPESPYQRIAILHITLIASGFIIGAIKDPAWGLIFMVMLKILLDLFNHFKIPLRELGQALRQSHIQRV